MKRLQNRIAESRLTLPVTAVYAALVAAAAVSGAAVGGLRSGSGAFGLTAPVALLAVAAWLMAELNNSNQLTGVYSRLVSCSFLAVFCLRGAWAFVDAPVAGAAAAPAVLPAAVETSAFGVALTAALIAFSLRMLFGSYQDRDAAGQTYYAFLSLALAALVSPFMLYFVPVVWLVMAAMLRTMSVRTLAASLFGLLTPAWALGAVALAAAAFLPEADAQSIADALMARLTAVANFTPLCRFEAVPLPYMRAFALTAPLSLIGTVYYLRGNHNDRIRTRDLYHAFILLSVAAWTLLVLQPDRYQLAFAWQAVATSPLIAHFFVRTSGRLTNALFVVTVAAVAALTLINLIPEAQ